MANVLMECSACEAIVAAETLAQYSAVLAGRSSGTQRITFARCSTCESPLVVSEELHGNERGREVWSSPYRLYPTADETFGPRMPRSVRKSYDEARGCFSAQAYSAATMMCSRTIQLACAEHNIEHSTLSASLGELRTQGIIETRVIEWAEALPHLNTPSTLEATLTREDARDALEFTDAFLAYLYTFRDRFNEFRRRGRTKAASRPQAVNDTAAVTAAVASAASPPSNGDGTA